MLIGNRLKDLRESKQLSQGDIEKRTGLLRCYISRVENASIHKLKPPKDDEWGSTGRGADYLSKLRKLLAKMEPGDQKLLFHMAQKVARA